MHKSLKLTDKIPIGKYKGRILGEIIDLDPKYIDWLHNHAKDNFSMDNASVNYLVDRLVIKTLLYVKNKVNKSYIKK